MNAAKSQAMIACQSTYNFEVAVKSCNMHLFDKFKQLEKKKKKVKSSRFPSFKEDLRRFF